jgi:hypothetical protein
MLGHKWLKMPSNYDARISQEELTEKLEKEKK